MFISKWFLLTHFLSLIYTSCCRADSNHISLQLRYLSRTILILMIINLIRVRFHQILFICNLEPDKTWHIFFCIILPLSDIEESQTTIFRIPVIIFTINNPRKQSASLTSKRRLFAGYNTFRFLFPIFTCYIVLFWILY